MTTPDTIEAYSFTEMREALDTEAAQREMIAQARAEGKAEGAREERERGAVFVDLDAGDGWIRIPIGEWEGSIRPRLEVIVVDLLHEHERRLAAYQKGYTDGLYGREPTPCA